MYEGKKESRAFQGIWISREIWLSKELSLQEKVFLVEIESLDNSHGCFASNAYFADFFDLSISRTSVVINNLVKKGLIESSMIYEKGSCNVTKRILRRTSKKVSLETNRPPHWKQTDPHTGNGVDSNTSNNTVNNKDLIVEQSIDVASTQPDPKQVKPEASAEVIDVINHLNKVVGSKYKPTTKSHRQNINARLKDYSVEDLKKVIDFKASEWLNDARMAGYLRPGTLFSADKFMGYLLASRTTTVKQGINSINTQTINYENGEL